MDKKAVAKNYRFLAIMLGAMVLGCIVGRFAPEFGNKISFLGTVFINMMFCVVVPLVFASIAGSVANMRSRKRAGKIMGTTVLTFVITGAIAAVIMFALMKIFPPVLTPWTELPTEELGEYASISDMIVNFFTASDFSGLLTRRAMLPLIVFSLLFMAFSCGLCFACMAVDLAIGNEWYSLFRFVWFALLPLLAPFVLAAAGVLVRVYETPRNRRIVKNAAKKLAESPCRKVGITGSFGKTSVKNFALAMLSRKYRVIATPASYNTPLGIARTVNEQGVDCDIFLAEMGARRTGDIKELCKIVNPSVGLVTGVTCQHLETFRSLEAIRAEKRELALFAKCCVLGKTAVDFCETASKEGQDFAAEEIVLSEEGVAFTLCLGEKRLPVKLSLYGRQTAQNVALAAALCLELGMSAEEIAEAVADIRPVPHRLEKREGNGLHILDDSYNSNFEGAKNAVEALRAFSGKKCVITPGLVELGDLEEEKNAELGELFAGLDLVILVGETRVLPVRRGYLQAGGEEERLVIVPALDEAVAKLASLSAGDCVLFLNDLPDKY